MEDKFEIKNTQEKPSVKTVEHVDTGSTVSSEQKEERVQRDNARIDQLRAELTGNESKVLTLRQKRDNLKGILFTDPEARGKIAQALGVSEDDIDIEGLEGVRKYKNDGDQILDRTVKSAHMMGWTEWKLKNGEILFANPDGTLGVKDTSN